jgi:CRP-like cAMP-binding protein
MTASVSPVSLKLKLRPQDVLPAGMTWRLSDGYVRSTTWDADGECITLGLWGPGDVITSELPALQPLDLQCLTRVFVERVELSELDQHELFCRERTMLAEILAIQRIRSAEQRLMAMLQWIGRSHGQLNSHGCRFSLSELNLTHRALADLCGLTRVTVTKLLGRFRSEGKLVAVGEHDLLIPSQP